MVYCQLIGARVTIFGSLALKGASGRLPFRSLWHVWRIPMPRHLIECRLLRANLRFEKDKVLHATSNASDDRKVHRRTSETKKRSSEMNEDSYLAFIEMYGHEEWMSSVASGALLHLHPVQSSCFSNVRYHQ